MQAEGGDGWRCRQIKRAFEKRGVSGIDGKRGKTKALKWVGVGKARGLRWAERLDGVLLGLGVEGWGESRRRESYFVVLGDRAG